MLLVTQSGIGPPVAALSAVSEKIWALKYRLAGAAGAPIEQSIEDTWDRVATALAAPEAEPALWAGRFRDALTDFKFMPAGRILAGAGTARDVTLCNCFVMGTIPD
ncbi:MAG: ribonucleotide reductase N-terminal alpha domain-containing protein, partial [Porticoccaceae bacterium]